jgi:hypothetical protein
MRVCLASARVMAAIAIALMLSSVSEARLFGRGRVACWTSYPSATSYQHVNPAPAQAAQGGTVASPAPAGPAITSVSQETAAPASAEAAIPSEPTMGNAAPMVRPSGESTGGWSILPRSMSDYGKFPPY